jgi:hypothetical protein
MSRRNKHTGRFAIRRLSWLLGVLLLAGQGPPARAEEPFSLAEALSNGRFTLQLRPRYNRIEESDKPKTTEGITVRAVPGWQSAPWHGLRVAAEFLHTGHLGDRRYNDDVTRAGGSPYPLLPDPDYNGANQLYLDIAAFDSTRVRVGRQMLRLDNLRFISDNDFRQTPLIFNGVTVTDTSLEGIELMAGHYTRVRTALGAYNPLDLTVLHAAWNPARGHTVAAYTYLHDQPQTSNSTGFANNSNHTSGLRAEGAFELQALELPYIVEMAAQRPYAGGDGRISARYRRLGAGLSGSTAYGNWGVRYDDEVKGSNAGLYGLQTPFTDLYAFNGWALHFTTTPRQGLRDRWATLRWQIGRLTLYAEQHRFASDVGGLNFGRETDLSLSYPILENAMLRAQHARYRPQDGPVAQNSVGKTWVTLTYTY